MRNEHTDDTQITPEEYSPDSELRSLLTEVVRNARVHYENENPSQVLESSTPSQLHYTVTFDGFELEATETMTPVGKLVSFEGHLGCAASVALANSLVYGEPTLLYLDEEPPSSDAIDRYQDLSTEWYREVAIEAGLPDVRMKIRPIKFETEMINLETLERWARTWLEAGKE